MAGLRDSLASLRQMRSLFQKRLAAAATGPTAPSADAPALREIATFGSNPGNLRMFVHVPPALGAKPGLVVALHGCTQTARAYAHGTGWCELADRHGFVVLFPEQQPANNPKNCFSWFLPADTARDGGEALSIRQMIEKAVSAFGIDQRRVFVTGLSAGGAMASVMLAAYPELFAGGAIIGGLPYGSAANVQEAFDAMFNDRAPSARALGDRVRAASKHRGPWPRISVWHGTADTMVKPSNAEHILSQWLNVQGLPREPSGLEQGTHYMRRVWNDSSGQPQLEVITVAGMGHGVPLATTGQSRCGAVGPFFLDVGVSATTHIARSWEIDRQFTAHNAVSGVTSRAIDAPAVSADGPSGQSSGEEEALPQMHPHFNPAAVIAAAFQAAGLQPPSASGRGNIDPASVIEAALKAAGLSRG
jgi:poly(hydroxyalkanoate) depolymerase family esterase